jgi:cytochrome c biogenesis protein CcmG/thiol:disulfide interchange protein DsbE
MLDRLGVSFPAVLDSEGTVAAAYRVTGMPTTFFIDERGIIRSAGAGIVTPETLRAELAKLGIELQPWE